jgi:hypothetical protein
VYVGGQPVYVDPDTRPAAAGTATGAGTGSVFDPVTPAGTPAGTGSVTGSAAVEDRRPTMAPAGGTTMTGGTSLSTGSGGGRRGAFEFNDLRAPENVKVIRIPLNRLRNGELQYNVVIRPKDTIIVQNLPVGEYYMGGHVGSPGAYTLTGRKITLKQAVISARMLDQLAIPERTDIVRRLGPDREVFVRVDLSKIFAGEQADIFLKPDDQVMVGTNAIAPFLAALRGAFRFTYGLGFIYDRNLAIDQERQSF